jgi:ABC-2 type transport system permease protein
MRIAFVIARREVAVLFFTPIAYVIGVLFLALQGFSFWAVVEVLSDPRQQVGYGAVLRTHFGGTVLYWAICFALIAVISMRLCAEEKRQGTWEALLTTPVSEFQVLAGKWLGGFTFYLCLWLPTLIFPVVLQAFSPPGLSIDPGPVVSAYLGVMLGGAAFVAIGVAASVTTQNQMVAAVTTFALLMALLFVGQARDFFAGAPPSLAALDVRAHMDRFASGEVDLAVCLFYVGLSAFGLALADALAVVGRRSRRELRARAATAALSAAAAALTVALAARHPLALDLSRSSVNTLDDATLKLLARLDQPIDVLLVHPTAERFDPIYKEVDHLLARMQAAQPMLLRHDLDPALEPERVAQLAAEFALPPSDLGEGGAVVFQRGEKRRAVDLLAMAGFARDELGVGAMTSFRAEQAFAAALTELSADAPARYCYSTGHGELPFQRGSTPHLAELGDRLRRDGAELVPLTGITSDALRECRVLLVIGPERPLSAEEALAVAAYLRASGGLFLALASRPERGPEDDPLPATGLEVVLAEYGLRFPAAVVIDPQQELEIPLTWMTATGYGDHPISAAFQGRRITAWMAPRPVLGGDPLVRPSPIGWGETDLFALRSGGDVAAGEGDLLGAPPVAAAARRGDGLVVVFGSARSLSSLLTDRGLGGATALAASALAWLASRGASPAHADIEAKTPERLRLLMTSRQRRAVFFACVIALPTALALFGFALSRRRRRG